MKQKRKLLRGSISIVSLLLCMTLLYKCQMVTYAYTDEEKEAAKQWLVQNGYSPDRGGANQAYQDYLNGKFDNEDPNNGDNQNGSQTPGDQNNQNGSQTPDDENNQNGSQTPDTQGEQQVQDEGESGTSQNGHKEGESQSDSQNTKDSKGKKNQNQDKNTEKDSGDDTSADNGQNGTASPDAGQENEKNSTNNGQNTTADVDSGAFTSDMTTEQEADFMKFVASQLAEDNQQGINQEERDKREAELYEQSLADSQAVSANGKPENATGDSQDVATSSELEEENASGAFGIWMVVSVVAVLALGGVCFLALKKR